MPKNNAFISKKTQKDTANKIKKKIEENLKNLTSKRLTIPLNFYELRTNQDGTKQDSNDKGIYGFLNNCVTEDCQNLRRSFRISQKDLVVSTPTTNCQGQQKGSLYHFNNNCISKSTKYKDSPKNKSKSIFQKINKKYALVQKLHPNTLLDVGSFDASENNADESIHFNYNFLQNKSTANSGSSQEQKEKFPICFNKPQFSKARNKYKDLSKNKSKSIFRDINKKFALVENFYSNTISEVGPFNISGSNSDERIPINDNFSEILFRQICVSYMEKTLAASKACTIKQLQRIEDSLYNGKSNLSQQEENVLPKNNCEEFQKDVDFDYIPASEWVYQTPPRRIAAPKLKECNIQPAVMYMDEKNKTIYEISSNANIDFTQCIRNDSIPHDDKYKKHLGPFKQNNCGSDGMGFLEAYHPNTSEFFTQFQLNQLKQATENNPHKTYFNVEDHLLGNKRNNY